MTGNSYGFIYLGLKKSRRYLGCRNMNITMDVNITTPVSGGHMIAADCGGHGTHAYAVTKHRASSLWKDIYRKSIVLSGNKQPQIDQVRGHMLLYSYTI